MHIVGSISLYRLEPGTMGYPTNMVMLAGFDRINQEESTGCFNPGFSKV